MVSSLTSCGAGDRVEDAERLGDDLGADAVAGDDGEPEAVRCVGCRHAQWPVSPPLSRRSMASWTACWTACFCCADGAAAAVCAGHRGLLE